jgi:hypothetical protein
LCLRANSALDPDSASYAIDNDAVTEAFRELSAPTMRRVLDSGFAGRLVYVMQADEIRLFTFEGVVAVGTPHSPGAIWRCSWSGCGTRGRIGPLEAGAADVGQDVDGALLQRPPEGDDIGQIGGTPWLTDLISLLICSRGKQRRPEKAWRPAC